MADINELQSQRLECIAVQSEYPIRAHHYNKFKSMISNWYGLSNHKSDPHFERQDLAPWEISEEEFIQRTDAVTRLVADTIGDRQFHVLQVSGRLLNVYQQEDFSSYDPFNLYQVLVDYTHSHLKGGSTRRLSQVDYIHLRKLHAEDLSEKDKSMLDILEVCNSDEIGFWKFTHIERALVIKDYVKFHQNIEEVLPEIQREYDYAFDLIGGDNEDNLKLFKSIVQAQLGNLFERARKDPNSRVAFGRGMDGFCASCLGNEESVFGDHCGDPEPTLFLQEIANTLEKAGVECELVEVDGELSKVVVKVSDLFDQNVLQNI